MEGITLLIVSFAMLLIGVPIGIALGIGMLAMLIVNPILPTSYIAQAMYSGLDSFPMLAIPVFMLAGAVMETGGLSKRLVNVANKMFGHTPGGLGTVTIMACMFFGAISGSSPATVAAIGMIMIPQMVKAGYDKYYATALVAVAGGLGVVVPPSIPMVLYGVTNNVSIGDLFLGGFGPALVEGGLLILSNIYFCKKKGYLGSGEKFSLKKLGKATLDAMWALFMPIIILGGIYGGIFTPTEAAVVSLVYGILVGLFIYKELSLAQVWKAFYANTAFVGGMMLVFAPAAAMGAIFVYLDFPAQLYDAVTSISTNVYVVLLMINLLMLVAGMFVNTTPAMVILSPLLLGIVSKMGIDPIHFGLIMVMNLEVAFVTPPVAGNLFVASSMTGISMERIAKEAMPFLLALFLALVIVTYVPQVTLYLIKAFGH